MWKDAKIPRSSCRNLSHYLFDSINSTCLPNSESHRGEEGQGLRPILHSYIPHSNIHDDRILETARKQHLGIAHEMLPQHHHVHQCHVGCMLPPNRYQLARNCKLVIFKKQHLFTRGASKCYITDFFSFFSDPFTSRFCANNLILLRFCSCALDFLQKFVHVACLPAWAFVLIKYKEI